MSADPKLQPRPGTTASADIIVLLPQDTAAVVLQALVGSLGGEAPALDEHREMLTALALFISDNLQEPSGSDVPACPAVRSPASSGWHGGLPPARRRASAPC